MASQVGGDLSRIEAGPCKITYKGNNVGHTMEGVKFNIKPDLRERKVDEYGTTAMDLIHQGDVVDVSTILAEKTLTVLQTVYQWGYSIDATTWGIGKIPGTKGTAGAGTLLLHPLDGVSTTDDVTFWNAVVKDSGEVNFGVITADRVFSCTFACLFSEAKGSIGRIGVATT